MGNLEYDFENKTCHRARESDTLKWVFLINFLRVFVNINIHGSYSKPLADSLTRPCPLSAVALLWFYWGFCGCH